MNPCVNNLRVLDGAKQQWALENRLNKGDPVAWDDIKPYIKDPYGMFSGRHLHNRPGWRATALFRGRRSRPATG